MAAIKITETELKLLTFMHETVVRYTPLGFMDGESAIKALECTDTELVRAVTYLQGWGLLGDCEMGTRGDAGVSPFYLTSAGENYIRLVEEELGTKPDLPKRLTLSALVAVGQVVRDVVVNTASAVLTRQVLP